jgi:hypothetical protein
MNILIDTIPFLPFASRILNDQLRFYGTHPDYPNLLIVLQGGTLTELCGQKAVALFQQDDLQIV